MLNPVERSFIIFFCRGRKDRGREPEGITWHHMWIISHGKKKGGRVKGGSQKEEQKKEGRREGGREGGGGRDRVGEGSEKL